VIVPDLHIVETHPIQGVIPGDFNYDGKLDVLLTGENPDTGSMYMHIWLGDFATFGKYQCICVLLNTSLQNLKAAHTRVDCCLNIHRAEPYRD
jgi:hypothetical protein